MKISVFLNSKFQALLFAGTLAYVFGVVILPANQAVAAPKKTKPAHTLQQPLPDFQDIEEAVIKSMTKRRKYYENDLITRSDAQKAVSEIKRIGWEIPESRLLVKRLLPEGDYLVKQLRSRKGFPFMRQISVYPQGFDRLDRLRYVVKGKKAVTQLINSKDGYLMIEYMTTTKEGKNMGSLVSKARNGKNFNKATGRIYSSKQLIEEIKLLHEKVANAIKLPVKELKKPVPFETEKPIDPEPVKIIH